MSKNRMGKRGSKTVESRSPSKPVRKNPHKPAPKPRRASLSTLRKREASLVKKLKVIQTSIEVTKTTKLTGRQIGKRLMVQQEAKRSAFKERRRISDARKAVRAYKVRSKDKGKLVFIGFNGGHDPQNKTKRRKGYLITVDKKGRKKLVRQPKYGYRATTFQETQAPLAKLFKAKHFQDSKRKTKGMPEDTETWGKEFRAHAKAHPVDAGVVRKTGKLKTGGQYEFSEKAVKKLAGSIQKTLQGQASHRIFIIRCMALVELPDGENKVFDFSVDIQKADHIIIRLTGIENFVRQRFYAYMARELSFLGFVTSGSSNHIRSLKQNKGKEKGEWKDRRGEPWAGRGKQIANLKVLEWKIEQAN